MRAIRGAVVAAVAGAWGLGWGCSSSSLPPEVTSPSGRLDSGTIAPTDATDAKKQDAGPERDAAEGGAEAGDAAVDAAIDSGPPPPPPVCPVGATWAPGVPLAISTGDDDFGSVTPDELTIVWTSGADGGSPTVYASDRSSTSAPFPTPTVVPVAAQAYLPGPLSVSKDGLRIVLQAPDTTFFVLSRGARGSAFDAAMTTAEFATINLEIASAESVVLLGAPVYGQADETFYYSRGPAGGGPGGATLLEATRTGATPWSDGVALNGSAIEDAGAGRTLRPTGISADDLTLFTWDEGAGTEMMAWRPTPSGGFASAASIGPLSGAQPNAACTAIYYSAPMSSGTGLFVAQRQ